MPELQLLLFMIYEGKTNRGEERRVKMPSPSILRSTLLYFGSRSERFFMDSYMAFKGVFLPGEVYARTFLCQLL